MISGTINLGRDNDARLLRLRTALELGTGFQLVLVEVEPGPIRKEVIRRIQTWSGRRSIGALSTVSLDPEATLAAQLGGTSGVIVIGLEPPSPTEVPARDWIAELNWSRDALPALVSGPLILVVSQAIHQGLFERASDLYSWRRHTSRVVVTVRELAVPLSSPGDRNWLEQRERISRILKEVVLTSRGRITLLFDLAEVLLQLGDEHGASRAIDELLGSRGSQPDDKEDELVLAYCELGNAECALVRRDFSAARSILDEARGVARVDELRVTLALHRGKLHAANGAWDLAVVELTRVIEFAQLTTNPYLLARAREGLCQVAFARGDIAHARHEFAALIEVASAHMDEWGMGILLRIAEVIVEVYPDEIAPALDAASATTPSASRAQAMSAFACLRAKRWWLLERIEAARAEIARAKRWIRQDDPAAANACLALCEAGAALLAGSTSEDEIAVPLVRARELFHLNAPKQAAVAGMLLGDFWRQSGRAERAASAYRVAVDDARGGGELELAAEAELARISAAVDGEGEEDDAVDELRVVAGQFQAVEHVQSEGIARTALGRCLLHRGLRDAAITELERARACFAATADAAREAWVVQLVETASP